jgi:glycosyltransferase involved in cell wall biosynthesis
MNFPTVAVIVPTFNRSHYLPECLDSLLNQTLAPAQLIVVNDGSVDDTEGVLRSYNGLITCISTVNLGKASAINLALDRVSSDYVWCFDDDDIAMPDALERFVEPLERHPECGFSYSTYCFAPSDPQGRIGAPTGETWIPPEAESHLLGALLDHNFLGGAAFLARSKCYEEIGGFLPDLIRSQDYDMVIRLARRYPGIRVAGGPTYYLRQHRGARGSQRDTFSSRRRFFKWLEYDQAIFRRLYREMPLEEYLPPGVKLHHALREAHLHRLAAMSSKLLLAEALEEVELLARLPESAGQPLRARERAIVQGLVRKRPYYRSGWMLDEAAFLDAIRKRASAPALAVLRRELARTLAVDARGRLLRHPGRAAGLLRRAARLYLNAPD